MAKSSKKKSGDDDELFPDTGAKPAKKATKKVEKPSAKAEDKPKKTETKKVEKPVAASVEPKAPEPAKDLKKSAPRAALPVEATKSSSAGPPKGVKLVVAGVALVAIVGASALMLPALTNDDSTRPKQVRTANNTPAPQQPNTPNTALKPGETRPQVQQQQQLPIVPGVTQKSDPMQPIGPAQPQALRTDGKTAKELAVKSANHGAVGRILDLFDGVRKVNFDVDNRLFEDYQAKQAREAELRAQIQALGMAGIDAIKDFVLNVNDDGYKIFLAKSLAEMKDPEALKAAAEILSTCHDIAVQTTLVRFLPETPESSGIIAGAFSGEENPNVRSMLLREYSRRIGEPAEGTNPNDAATQAGLSDQARGLFRKAALEDPDPNVRAEAVSIIGHRGDARDMELMQQIAKGEQNLQIRQSAIVAYATTGQETSLPFLEDLAQHEDSLEIRASAVLAIARVGNDRAIQILDQIAQTDQREEIKTRAAGFAASLRAKQQADRDERRGIDAQPVPLNPDERRGG